MLRAATLAERRKLELRVVPLPPGTDPADLLQSGGREAMEAAVSASVPFVRFRVQRILEGGDHSSPEGRDRMIDELRPVFAALSPSAMRDELVRIVSGRLELKESLAEQLLSGGGRRAGRQSAPPGSNGDRRTVPGLTRREEAERAFLALCIASPETGAQALASLDVEEHFDSELLRRGARWLREGSLAEPLANRPGQGGRLEEDPELGRLLAELVVEAGRDEAHPAMLEVQRLQLELARVERQIQRARGQESTDVSELATRRTELKREFDTAYGEALEHTGEREG
jgi:DNA primase